MKKAIIFAVILIMSCAMLQLASCNISPIEVSDNGDICEYEGQKYVCILDSDWKLKLQPSQVKKIGVHQGKAYSLDDVFITLESVPEVVIIDYNKYQSQIDLNFCLPYIREDIRLASVYETVYESVYVEYGEDVSPSERYFDELPSGINFYNLVGENNEGIFISPKEWEYYGDLHCTYPGISYLECRFGIVCYKGEYYLSVDRTPDGDYDSTYYRLDIERIRSMSKN